MDADYLEGHQGQGINAEVTISVKLDLTALLCDSFARFEASENGQLVQDLEDDYLVGDPNNGNPASSSHDVEPDGDCLTAGEPINGSPENKSGSDKPVQSQGSAGKTASGPINKSKRKAKMSSRKHDVRKRQRIEEEEELFGVDSTPRDDVVKKYHDAAKPLNTSFDISKAKVESTAYAGDSPKITKKKYALHELVGEGSLGFTLVEWDGVTPTPLYSGNIMIGLLAGRPSGPDWDSVAADAAKMLARASQTFHPPKPKNKKAPLRGIFKVLHGGISHGGGRSVPSNPSRSSNVDRAIVEEFEGSTAFRRLAGFATAAVCTWAPDLHQHYAEKVKAVLDHHPNLKRNFRTNIFTANTYNLGPRTVCYRHFDAANVPYGWCAITPLGDFDHRTGGHVILFEAKLVIEVPPGSTVLIPSAILSHGNTDIGSDEHRYSFTQYTSGSLFRWVDLGFRNKSDIQQGMTSDEKVKQKVADDAEGAKRWIDGLSLLPRRK